MSYTTSDLVRQYLTPMTPTLSCISNQPLLVLSNDYLSFFSGAVEDDSVKVKSVCADDFVRADHTLAVGGNSLSQLPVVHGSVVVASDSSLGIVYVENEDYLIDYDQAVLHIKSGGVLSAGMAVSVWLQPYSLYAAGSDYDMNYTRGEIRSRTTGSISLGETIWLDYRPRFETHTDELIEAAVVSANGLIERRVDINQEFGADQSLQSAATFCAVATLCRASAVRDLSRSLSVGSQAQTWLKVADEFQRQAEKLLAEFEPARTNVRPPQMT